MSVFSMAASNPAAPTYPLQRSVRLRASNSAYFNRTFGTPTSGNIFTWSGWVKRGAIGAVQPIFNPSYAGGEGAAFNSSSQLVVSVNGAFLLVSTAVYRDPSAWYHIVLVSDMGNATASLRFRVYVNGVEVTSWGTDARASYTSFPYWNKNTVVHYMGYSNAYPAYGDGYLTEVNFVDGQALTPSSFGAYNNYGVWSPARYSGSYGNNGFYLNFQDNSSVTTTANVGIGKDSSGQGNYWTSNGINVTAYSGTPPNNVSYDSMLDVPTNTSSTNANYATLNPINVSGGTTTFSNGNLAVTAGFSTTYAKPLGTIGMSSGKWYWETTIVAVGSAAAVGVGDGSVPSTTTGLGGAAGELSYVSNGQKYTNNTATAYGASYTTNDVIGIAYDADAGSITFYKNGVSQGAITGLSGTKFPGVSATGGTAQQYAVNFGQRPFSYTPPTGFKSLNTFNLPDSIVPVGAQYMAVTTYTGNGTTQSIVNTTNNPLVAPFSNNPSAVPLQPDFLWVKTKSGTTVNWLVNSITGANSGLISNSTSVEQNLAIVTSLNSSGFSVSTIGNTNLTTNGNTATYVAWQWRASNASAVTNTDGNITTQVSVNRTAGFSIITYTGNGTNPGGTIGHGLGTTPSFIIAKSRGVAEWPCYHASLPISNTIYLNATYASNTYLNRYSAVSPTTFTTGSNGSELNTSTVNYVAYCWAEVPGFSKFGSYTGNGSATSPPDGTFVYLGFRPRWVLVKSSSAVEGWVIWDSSRNTYNTMPNVLYPNLPNSEGGSTNIDFLSNGFKLRNTATNGNITGVTYIYAAFAENPFKNALAR